MGKLRLRIIAIALIAIMSVWVSGCAESTDDTLTANTQGLSVDELSEEQVVTSQTTLKASPKTALNQTVLRFTRDARIINNALNRGTAKELKQLRDQIVRNAAEKKTRIFYVFFKVYNNDLDNTTDGRVDVSHGRLDLVNSENLKATDNVLYDAGTNSVDWTLSPSKEEKQVVVRINISHRDVPLEDLRMTIQHGGETLTLSLRDLPKIPTQFLVKNNIHLSASGFNLGAEDCAMGAISGTMYSQGNSTIMKGVWHDPVLQVSTVVEMVKYDDVVNGITSNGKYPTGITMNGQMWDANTLFGTYYNKFNNDSGFFDGKLYISEKDPTDVSFRGQWQAECITK